MKANRNLITNKEANTTNVIILAIFTAIMGFGMITIGNYLYFSIATNADAGTQIAVPGQRAIGTMTFTGNTSSGELFNITNGAAVYRFEFNTTHASPTMCKQANCIIVNVYNTNRSTVSSTNLTSAINSNASVAAFLSAADTTNVTTLTYASRGVAGNSITLSDNVANAVSGGLTGGIDDITGQSTQNTLNNYASLTFPLMGLAILILSFGVIYITLKRSFGSQVGR